MALLSINRFLLRARVTSIVSSILFMLVVPEAIGTLPRAQQRNTQHVQPTFRNVAVQLLQFSGTPLCLNQCIRGVKLYCPSDTLRVSLRYNLKIIK